MRQAGLYGRLLRELAGTDLPRAAAAAEPVTEDDLSGLPEPTQRYLRFMGVVGRPRDWSFRAHVHGRFRRSPGDRWMPCETWQYNSGVEVARIFLARARIAGLLSMTAQDTYLRGRGQMTGKLLELVTVVDAKGPEFDVGELVVYINDAVLMAPSFLLGPRTSWSAVDDESFDLTFSDGEHRVSARVFIDERGAVRDFTSMDKLAALPGSLVAALWHTPIEGWQSLEGRQLPTRGSAMYDLEEGPFPYIEFAIRADSIVYNVAPASE
jgi:Family of unknown function (DUF6544)